jgi:hypothetical protein
VPSLPLSLTRIFLLALRPAGLVSRFRSGHTPEVGRAMGKNAGSSMSRIFFLTICSIIPSEHAESLRRSSGSHLLGPAEGGCSSVSPSSLLRRHLPSDHDLGWIRTVPGSRWQDNTQQQQGLHRRGGFQECQVNANSKDKHNEGLVLGRQVMPPNDESLKQFHVVGRLGLILFSWNLAQACLFLVMLPLCLSLCAS